MTTPQTKSKQRVANYGEVYTNIREVNAMLDLVADQASNPEKTFLEPACGNGNFLAEILNRKLATLKRKHKKIQLNYERNAIVAIGSLYGIELLPDNAQVCRERLLEIFTKTYKALYPKTFQAACLQTAQFILSKNIICGNALDLKTEEGGSIIFSEWKLTGSQLKRRDYVYLDLINKTSKRDKRELPLFSDLGEEAYIPTPIKEYPEVHFLDVAHV